MSTGASINTALCWCYSEVLSGRSGTKSPAEWPGNRDSGSRHWGTPLCVTSAYSGGGTKQVPVHTVLACQETRTGTYSWGVYRGKYRHSHAAPLSALLLRQYLLNINVIYCNCLSQGQCLHAVCTRGAAAANWSLQTSKRRRYAAIAWPPAVAAAHQDSQALYRYRLAEPARIASHATTSAALPFSGPGHHCAGTGTGTGTAHSVIYFAF